jgi:hypothetical protein
MVPACDQCVSVDWCSGLEPHGKAPFAARKGLGVDDTEGRRGRRCAAGAREPAQHAPLRLQLLVA